VRRRWQGQKVAGNCNGTTTYNHFIKSYVFIAGAKGYIKVN